MMLPIGQATLPASNESLQGWHLDGEKRMAFIIPMTLVEDTDLVIYDYYREIGSLKRLRNAHLVNECISHSVSSGVSCSIKRLKNSPHWLGRIGTKTRPITRGPVSKWLDSFIWALGLRRCLMRRSN
jgi:hypothetical protein